MAGDLVCGIVVYPRLAGHFLGIVPSRLYWDILRVLGMVGITGTLLATMTQRLSGATLALVQGGSLVLFALIGIPVVLGREDSRWLWRRLRAHR